MPPKHAQAELEKARLDRSILRLRLLCGLLLAVIPWVGAVGLMYLVYRTVEALAGKATSAEIAILGGLDLRFLASRYASQFIFAVFGGGGMAYGVRQKRLHDETAERLRRIEGAQPQREPERRNCTYPESVPTNRKELL